MLLFVMCLTMNVLFCGHYDHYESLDKTTAIETGTISENIVVNEDGDDTTFFRDSFSNKNNANTETITKNLCQVIMSAAIPREAVFFFIIDFLFMTLSILLPDGWTLINQKVRLDN